MAPQQSCAHHHAKQSPVDMDEEAVFAVAGLPQDVQDSVQVIHGSLHCGAAIHIDDGRPLHIGCQHRPEMLIVHLTICQCVNLQQNPTFSANKHRERARQKAEE